MKWATAQDYNEAIQNSATSLSDPVLKAGEVMVNAMGLPIPYSGNFADVYQFKGGDGKLWAIKCFTRQIQGLQQRYTHIHDYLAEGKLPFTVGFEYQPEGIRIRGTWYPILKMEWVEGLPLNIFVRDNLDKPQYLQALVDMWGKLAARLRDANFAHADLQHGNVLLVPGSTLAKLGLKLIDYDGMWVPALAKSPSGEVGHPNYQHPLRKKEQLYNADVDRVPHLVIASALRAACVGGKALWDKFDNGDNMFFREADLQNPGKAQIFKTLWTLGDPVLRTLIGHLAMSVGQPLRKTPWLDDVLSAKGGPKLNSEEEKEVCELLGVEPPGVPTKPAINTDEASVFARLAADDDEEVAPAKPRNAAKSTARSEAEDDDEQESTSRASRKRGARTKEPAPKSKTPLFIGGGVLALAIIGGVLALTLGGKKTPPVDSRSETANSGFTHNSDPEKKDTPSEKEKTQSTRKETGKYPPGVAKEKDKYPPTKKEPAKSAIIGGEPETGLPDGTVGFLQPTPVVGVAGLPGTHAYFYVANDDPGLYLGVASGTNRPQLAVRHGAPITAVACSGDGTRVITGDKTGKVTVWAIELLKNPSRIVVKRIHNLGGGQSSIKAVAISADGGHAVSLDRSGQVCWWDSADGKQINAFPLDGAGSLAMLPDGKRMLFGAETHGAGIWDLEMGKKTSALMGHIGSCAAVCVSSDGKTGFTAGNSETIHIWNLENGQPRRVLELPKPGVSRWRFHRMIESWRRSERTVESCTGRFKPANPLRIRSGNKQSQRWRS